jgi:hypothetical protein
VGFLSFGKTNPRANWPEACQAMAQATSSLEGVLETFTTGKTGVLVRPAPDQSATQAKAELEGAIGTVDRTQAGFEVENDDHGHPWVVVSDDTLQHVCEATQAIGDALIGSGIEDRVIAAVFPFTWKEQRVYWIYQPRLRSFTPFAPVKREGEEGGKEERDHPLEVRMEAATRRDLPTARDVSQWYPIWGMPV